MANPQLENGHTQIANEILEAISTINLSPYESRILWFVVRKTYGWHKKSDLIPLSQIADGTGITKSHVSRALKSLISKQIITRLGNKQIGFQKDWERWNTHKLPVQVTNEGEDNNLATKVASIGTLKKLPVQDFKLPVQVTKVTSSGNKRLPAGAPQKKERNYSKETIQKKEYGEFNNVLLADEEYQKLQDKFGVGFLDRIESLSSAIESKGYKYRSHYATILSWERRDQKTSLISPPKSRGRPLSTEEEIAESIKFKGGK